MHKKLISFVQPNFTVGPTLNNRDQYFFPYATGCLWAYASSFSSITQKWQMEDFIFRRDPIDSVVDKLAKCSVVGFSTYVWNKNYNYKLAALLKQRNPNCLIIFGGPEVPVTKSNLFEVLPFADIVVVHEGEKSFKAILDAYGTSYDHIPGLIINQDGLPRSTGVAQRIDNIDELPSPYLTGVFDKLMDQHPEVSWGAQLETNRGCPYQCTFCDWGSLTYNKVKKFNLVRVRQEIDWFGQKGIRSVYIIDANLGIFVDRDSEIIDYAIETKDKYGLPNIYHLSWAKNQQQDVVKLAKKMIDAGLMAPGVNTSVQSLDPYVLDVIKRKNLDVNKIEEICRYCETHNIPVNTELILGLPGETLISWKNNYWRLFDVGNHHGIMVFPAQMLENAEMNLKQQSLFKINKVAAKDYFLNSCADDTVEESIDLVVSTSTMPVNDMRQAYVFSWYMFTTHQGGTTTLFARFLNKFCNESYENFYTKLFQHLQDNKWFVEEQHEVEQFYDELRSTGYTTCPVIGKFKLSSEIFLYKTRMRLLEKNNTDSFVDLIGSWINDTYNLDPALLNDLIVLQKNYCVNIYSKIKDQYPKTLLLQHDILGYIKGHELNQPTDLEISYDYPIHAHSLKTFFQMFHYARRRKFIFTDIKILPR